jgi:hypothetical protein
MWQRSTLSPNNLPPRPKNAVAADLQRVLFCLWQAREQAACDPRPRNPSFLNLTCADTGPALIPDPLSGNYEDQACLTLTLVSRVP